jgi:hypothetical protein
MKTSIKFIGMIGLLTFVILTSGCTYITNLINPSSDYSVHDTSYNNSADTPTKSFSAYGISFKYPSNWYAYSDNASGSTEIIATKGVGFNNIQFQVQIIPNNGMSEENAVKQIQESITLGWAKIGSYSIKIGNETAYEDIYTVNDTHYSKLMRFANIYFSKNDKTYLILLQAPENEFDQEKPNFSVILSSFKVQ